MSGIIINEDCTHFIISRHRAGIEVDLDELNRFIDQYANTDVKEFVINVNGMLAWFPSKSRESAIDKYAILKKKGGILDENLEYVETLYDIYINKKLDMYQIWIDRLRKRDISPWLSIRMNDIHNNDDEEHFLHSSFFRTNKHFRRVVHRPNADYYDNAMDYSHPEVREHYLSLIQEVTEKYDFDGLELDWMREIFCFKVGGELDGIEILNGFMQEVRAILDEAEEKRNHRIKIGVRVPSSPEQALRFGMDVINWAREGLVDVIVPTARWATTDNDMPIDLWKRILTGTGVTLAAGLEILIEGIQSPEKQWMFNSLESARGSAVAYLGMGADRVYLFNYMDLPTPESFDPMMADSAVDTKYYNELLTTVGNLNVAKALPRRHIVTYHDITAPGIKNANILPVFCNPRNPEGRLRFNSIRIPTGPVEEDSELTIIIGVDIKEELDSSDFLVYLNSKPCRFIGIIDLQKPKPNCITYAFVPEDNKNWPDASIIEIATTKRKLEIQWAELSIVVVK